jgi:hypothetical protein
MKPLFNFEFEYDEWFEEEQKKQIIKDCFEIKDGDEDGYRY